jgi:hypothetical protein
LNAITRAQVYVALCKSNCFVPDFRAREKTALTWNKVYISIQEGKLCFVELNFLHRIFRYIVGSLWYSDTIFADKAELEKVKEYVHSIKAQLADQNPVAMDLLSKAQTTSDFICLQHMLGNSGEQNGFSEDFLSEAISLVRKNPDDKMWMNIKKVLDSQSAAKLNKALLHEILGLKEGDDLPSRQIGVPCEIKDVFEEGIEKANGALKDIGSPQTLASYLKALGKLEKINKDLDSLPEVLRPYLAQESGKQMVENLSDSLIVSQAHRSLVKAYLEDEQQIANRLCYHAGLETTFLSSQVKEKMKEYRAAVVKELDNNYQVAKIDYKTDSFSACCARYQKPTKMTWREQITDELFRDAEYQTLGGDRIKEDKREFTLDQYSQWIKKPQSSIGLPELKMFSKLSGHPVVIVKQVAGMGFFYFIWINGINLDFDKEPIILDLDNKGIWSPVEPF